MKLLSLLFATLLIVVSCYAQKNDTLRKYLDNKLEFASRATSAYPAIAIRQTDGWFLMAMYPDTSVLLRAYFSDKNFTIKNGPYILYHPKNIKAVEGAYVSNVPQGPWRYWHANGQLKDSGVLINNVMCGLWQSWSASGKKLLSANYTDKPVNPPARTPARRKPTMLPDMSPVPGVRQGVSITYYDNGSIQDSGNYNADFKTGLWKSWYPDGSLSSVGEFERDSLAGNWTFYRENGQKSTEETYKNGRLQAMTCYDSTGNKTGDFCSILKPPVPMGDFENFADYVLDNVFWPKELINSNVQGKVKIQYVITKNGELTNFKIVESPHQLLSNEVTRFFSTIEQWSPAVSHNRTIDFPMEFEIPFYR